MSVSNEDEVTKSASALLAEIVKLTDDVAAPGEIKDLADALAVLAPLVRTPAVPPEAP